MPSNSVLFMAGRAVIAGLCRGMTRHAGAHVVHHLFGDQVALPNRSVAGLTCRACCGMHAMAEIDVSRDLIDADPRNRLLLSGGGGHLLDVRTVHLYRLVTAHAETLRGKPHELAGVGVSVA